MARISWQKLCQMKANHEKIATLTCYDAAFAGLLAKQGIEAILVGDSLGNVVQGASSTVPVTVDDIAYHTKAVVAGNDTSLIIADMPFGSYTDEKTAVKNAVELIKAGANMVKMEGGAFLCDTVAKLTEQSIPVCAHIGLLPQSINMLGQYKVQAKEADEQARLIKEAKQLEDAGAKLLVVECVSAAWISDLVSSLTIPVIGIGAGHQCDGQILVLHDMLGVNTGYVPSFVRDFAKGQSDGVAGAIANYVSAVKNETFPGKEETFS